MTHCLWCGRRSLQGLCSSCIRFSREILEIQRRAQLGTLKRIRR